MTWKEFKAEVDRQLKEKGISEDTEFWYIDANPDRVHVELEDGKLKIY